MTRRLSKATAQVTVCAHGTWYAIQECSDLSLYFIERHLAGDKAGPSISSGADGSSGKWR